MLPHPSPLTNTHPPVPPPHLDPRHPTDKEVAESHDYLEAIRRLRASSPSSVTNEEVAIVERFHHQTVTLSSKEVTIEDLLVRLVVLEKDDKVVSLEQRIIELEEKNTKMAKRIKMYEAVLNVTDQRAIFRAYNSKVSKSTDTVYFLPLASTGELPHDKGIMAPRTFGEFTAMGDDIVQQLLTFYRQEATDNATTNKDALTKYLTLPF